MKLDKTFMVITIADIVREVIVFAVCLLAAFGINVYAIVHYQTEWSELYTEIGFVLTIALIIYGYRCAFKIICKIIWWIYKKIRAMIENYRQKRQAAN